MRTLPELKADQELRSRSISNKKQKITINRLKYKDGAKMFDYLREFQAERAKYTRHRGEKFDMAVVLRKAKTRKLISTNIEQAYLSHMSSGHQLKAGSTRKPKHGNMKQKEDGVARSMNLQERTNQSKVECGKRKIQENLKKCLQLLEQMGKTSHICRSMVYSKYGALTEQIYYGDKDGNGVNAIR